MSDIRTMLYYFKIFIVSSLINVTVIPIQDSYWVKKIVVKSTYLIVLLRSVLIKFASHYDSTTMKQSNILKSNSLCRT